MQLVQPPPQIPRPPLRILLTAYVRFGNALAWHTLELARGLRRYGHDVFLFCQKDSPLAAWSEGSDFQVNRDFDLNHAHPAEIRGGLSALRRVIREFKPDILNPHCPPGHSYLAIARWLEKSNAPLIRSVDDPRKPNRNALNALLHQRATDGVLFTTESSRKRYWNVFDLAHTRVILPGFRADDFVGETQSGGYRQLFGTRDDQLLIGIIARMSPEKGQEVFLDALTLLAPEIRNRIFCVMAGEDSRERGQSELRAMATRLGVESNVAFLERLPDVRPLMSELDIGLITSVRSEAVCRVALEYMSFGIPVISSDVNILSEVVLQGRNGWSFPNRDAQALADCLTEAVTNPEERHKRGKQGYSMVHSEFSLDHEVEETLAFYESIAATVQRGRA